MALLAGALGVLYTAFTFAQVWMASHRDERTPADALVVLGAAQYDGRPSPVLRARLDHAHRLYEEGLAEVVVVTGGRREGDRFTEAAAAARYLRGRGVPDEALRLEVHGTSSWESLAASARFLHDEGADDVLLVSDPYHAYRIAAIAESVGLHAHVSPVPDGPVRGFAHLRALTRETAAVAVGRVVGYQRLLRLLE